MPGNNLRTWAILVMTWLGNSRVKKSSKSSKNTSRGTKAVASQGGKTAGKNKSSLAKTVLAKGKRHKSDQRKPASPKLAPPSPTLPKSSANQKSKSPTRAKESSPQSVLFYQEKRARIARRAYELYEERCRVGEDVLDWLRAEGEIMQSR